MAEPTVRRWGIANKDHKPHWRNGNYTIDGNSESGDAPFTAYGDSSAECKANGELIIFCVNLHDEFVEACRAVVKSYATGQAYDKSALPLVKRVLAKAE